MNNKYGNINRFEMHIIEQITTRSAGINNMVMQMRGEKLYPGMGKWVKIPLLPENVARNPREHWRG